MKISRIFGLLLAGAIHATHACETDCAEQCRVSYLEGGASYTRANIKIAEHSFNGNLGGIQGSYEYKPLNFFYGALRAAWKEGKTKDSSANRHLVYIDAQERIGYTFASCCNDWSVTFFSGFGFRYLSHKLKEFDEPSIKFEYNEFYVPVGFLSEMYFSPCLSLGLNVIWMPQVYSSVEIEPLKGARWVLRETVGNVLVELPLTYTFAECYAVIFKPFYEHWEDGRSTARSASGQSLGLPKNSYNFWGAELSFAFLF